GHRLMGTSLLFTGDIAEGRAHCDAAIGLYDPVAHRPLATSFGQDVRVSILCYRSWAFLVLGYPEAALADAAQVLEDERQIGHAPVRAAICTVRQHELRKLGGGERARR